jgi:hypothetical protein
MMSHTIKVPRSRILSLAAIAAAAFVLAFAGTQAGRSAAVSAGDAPGQQIESSMGVPDSLSAVGAIPGLAPKPAPAPPARRAGQTSTTGAVPVSGTASQPSAPTASTPQPAAAAPQAATPKAAPAPSPGVSFDDSG